MRNRLRLLLLLLLLPLLAVAHKSGYTLNISVNERHGREAVMMATLKLQPTGIMAVTDMNGKATMQNVPAGDYMLQISYVGFETINARVKMESDKDLKFVMVPTSLALKGVTVTARQNASGSSTSSIIGRQAIDHLQATSLADVMQLIPGHLMGNSDLTSASNLQLRQLVNNNTSAFGASIVIDGGGDFTFAAGEDLIIIKSNSVLDIAFVGAFVAWHANSIEDGIVITSINNI